MTSPRRRRRVTATPRKPVVRVPMGEVLHWLDRHAGEFYEGNGRPPAGQFGLSTAMARALRVHVRTAKRMIAAARRRRRLALDQAAVQAGLDPATASLIRAIAERYAGKTVTEVAGKTVTPEKQPQRSRANSLKTQDLGPLLDPYDPQIEAAVLAWIAAAPGALSERIRTSLPPPTATRSAAPASGSLSAVGLRVEASVKNRQSRVYTSVDALQEALDALLGEAPHGVDQQVLALAQRLQDLIAKA